MTAAENFWRCLPAAATSPRTRATGWLAAVSMVLDAAWLLVTQRGWIWVGVVVAGTFGLSLGWVAVATCTNVTAALVSSGVDPGAGVAVS